MPHIKRSGGSCIMETQITKDSISGYPEFLNSHYIESKDQSHQRTDLSIIKRDYSAGLTFEITKFGDKRRTSLSVEIGADELAIMVEFFSQVKDKMRNYSGEVKILSK